MKHLIMFITALLIFSESYSQKSPIKYGKPNAYEISINNYDNAPAVILCDYGQYYFDGRTGKVFFYFSRHIRIKILKEEGLKYATQTIPFYDLTRATYIQSSSGYELRGQTINVESNGKLVKSKLKGKYIDRNENFPDFTTEITFHFPDVKVGSIIEYELNIPTIEIVNPPVWYMQYEIPVIHSELRITTPEDFYYGVRSYNCDMLDISEQKSETSSISYSRGSLVYPAIKLQFAKNNIPAYTNTDVANNGKSERMYMKFMLERATRKFVLPGMEELFKAIDPTFKYLDKAEKYNVLRNSGFVLYNKPDMAKISKDLMKDQGFGPPLVINLGLNDSIKKITSNCSNPEEKAIAIYKFVSSNMAWDSTYRVFVNRGFPLKVVEFINKVSSGDVKMNTSLSKPFRKHIGSSSEINFILINLLNTGGIKAYPVLVSTLDKEILDTAFFNLHQFNHVVAYVEIGEKKYLLDAVKKGNGAILTEDILNPWGLLVRRDEASWINLRKD